MSDSCVPPACAALLSAAIAGFCGGYVYFYTDPIDYTMKGHSSNQNGMLQFFDSVKYWGFASTGILAGVCGVGCLGIAGTRLLRSLCKSPGNAHGPQAAMELV